MIKVVAKGIEAFKKQLEKDQKQFKFATSLALNKTVKKIRDDEVKEMKRVFDRPTKSTINGMGIEASKKTKLIAGVYLKDYVARYLEKQITGGSRREKLFEKRLSLQGVMPSGMKLVPSRTAKLNNYGNISKRTIVNAVSGNGKYFAGYIGKTFGVWQESRGGIKLLMIGIKRATYKKRFDFYSVANRSANKYFAKELRQAIDFAIKTSR